MLTNKKKKGKILRYFILLIISVFLISGSSYFIYAETTEKTTITCVDEKMFDALKKKLNQYILLGDADSSNLTIKIPTSNISDITQIDLENSEISDITGIEKLTSLVTVNLSKNKIKDITPLTNLTNITDLNLNNNSELGSSSSMASVIGSKTNLIKLQLSSIGLSDISFLSNLTNLKELYMASASFNNLTDIVNLKQLTTLDVSYNTSLRSLETILNFTNLRVLNISNTKIDTLEIDSKNGIGIYNLRELEELYVRGLDVRTYPICKTYIKEHAYQDQNGIWVNQTTAYLEKIKKLDISYVNTNGKNGIVSFYDLSYLTNLEVLHMQGDYINNLDNITNLKKIKEINLAENKISNISKLLITTKEKDSNGVEIEIIKGYLRAKSIDLHDNQISDVSVFRKLLTVNTVINLDLQKNNIADISSLEGLNTDNCNIRLYNQIIDINVFYKKIESDQYIFLSPIFQQAKNPESIVYSENAEYITKGCTLNSGEVYQQIGNYNAIIEHKWTVSDTQVSQNNPDAREKITVTLSGGIADGSKIRFIISTDTNSIDSLKFNDPNFASAVRRDLSSRENANVYSGGQILNVNNYLIAQTYNLNVSNGNISDITGIESFYNLYDLNLSKNFGITTLNPLIGCINIKVLDASETSIGNNSKSIKTMTQLNTLILNNVGMTSIETINDLINYLKENNKTIKLETIDVSSNSITNIDGLEKIKTLKNLIVTNNPLEKVPDLSTLTNLEKLSMYSDKLTEIPKLTGLKNLQYVLLSNNKISDISNLRDISSELIDLDLSNNLVTDESMEILENIVIRSNLNLSGNILTDISGLSRNIGTLQQLDISRNYISDISIIDNRFSKNSKLYASNQRIAVVANSVNSDIMEVDLPQIFKASKQSSSFVYSNNDFILQNCTVENNKVKINLKELGDKIATVQIDQGLADGTTLAIVVPIEANITYNIETKTAQDVIATINFINRNHVTITNNNGNNQYTFKDNGEFVFKYIDDYGMTGEKTAKVTWMDKKAPTLTIKYSTTELTKDPVTVTITSDEEVQSLEGWTISNDKKTLTKKYSENKTEEIIVKDILGNETKQNIEIANIDKIPPEIIITYSTTSTTKNPVKVKMTSNEEIQGIEGWTLSENKKELTKEYRKNTPKDGETVIVKDLAGNETTQKIIINNIESTDVEPSIKSTKYEVKDEKIRKISPNTKISDLKKDLIIVADNIKIYDTKNQTVADSATAATGMKIVLDDELEYTLIIKGDTNGDSKADLIDLISVNKHRLKKTTLSGVYFEAGDVNYDNKVDLQDLIQINKHRLGKTSL